MRNEKMGFSREKIVRKNDPRKDAERGFHGRG
jgi:hypothetical protein